MPLSTKNLYYNVILIAVQWIARPDSKGEGGKIFSNVVTDEANVKVNDNPQAFLSIGTVLTKSEQSRYTVVEVIQTLHAANKSKVYQGKKIM